MAESIREVIARMKNNQKSSQSSVKAVPTPTPTPTPKPVEVVPQEIKEVKEDHIDEDVKEEEKPVENPEKQEADVPIEQRIGMEIEMLQNDGRFRVELLHQLQEINKAMVVIAGMLVDLAEKNGKA